MSVLLQQKTVQAEKPIRPCLSDNVASVKYNTQPIDTNTFINLEGDIVEWLGYAPSFLPGHWTLNRTGVFYGFKGLNINAIERKGIIKVYDIDGEIIDEFSLVYYPPKQYYILTQIGNPDYKGTCMWWVNKYKIEVLLNIN